MPAFGSTGVCTSGPEAARASVCELPSSWKSQISLYDRRASLEATLQTVGTLLIALFFLTLCFLI